MKAFKNPALGDIEDRIYREILRLRSEGGTSALALVIRTTGSTPGKLDFKMLVYPSGEVLGTVGGGTFEARVISEALQVIKKRVPRVFDFKFSGSDGLANKDQPICGGEMTVFIEPIYAPPKLYIMGAGHIGQALARIAKMVGFKVIVIDDREEFANRQNFPDADEIRLLNFDEIGDKIEIDEGCYIAIVTRGHQYDKMVLKAFIRSKATYIGMVGSKRKVKETFQSLMDYGIEKELLECVHAPIGLKIGAQTPSEIAVSIIAEIVAHRYGICAKESLVKRASYARKRGDT